MALHPVVSIAVLVEADLRQAVLRNLRHRAAERRRGVQIIEDILANRAQLKGVGAAIAVARIEDIIDGEAGALVETHRGAHRVGIAGAGIALVGRFEQIIDRSVALAVIIAELQRKPGVAEFAGVEQRLHHIFVELAVADLQLAPELLRRLGRDEVDRAAGGVAAVKRALRTAQHLDAFEIHHVEQRPRRTADDDAIDIEANGRIGGQDRIIVDDAADRDRGIGGRRGGFR